MKCQMCSYVQSVRYVLYLFGFDNTFTDKLNEKLPDINADLENEFEVQPNVANVVPATIPLGGGDNMEALFAGWNDTCVPYGCNGTKAGDMAMTWAGLEASGDIRFTDTKPAGTSRRFPVSYSPTTNDTANGPIRKHFGDQNEITDFGAWINPTVTNQALRVITEHGKLDLSLNPSTPGEAKSAPFYLSEPVAADKPLGLYLPHLELDPTGPNLFAADIFAAIGVGFNSVTRKLVPASVGPNDPGLRVKLNTLKCDSTSWTICTGFPDVVDDVVNWVGNTVLNELLQNSIGQVTIPNTAGFNLSGFQVLNEDGHLGIRASVGASQLRVWGGINPTDYDFVSFFEGFDGTGDVTYQWTITDLGSGATVYSATTTDHSILDLPTSALTPITIPFFGQISQVLANVVATRGTTTETGSHLLTLY